MDRRTFVIGTAASAAALATGPVIAQDAFPSHAITIINAFPPGGINEIVTRPLASAMEPILKQPVVVETKAGAAGQVGAQVVASAKPDGYTILSHNTGISGYAEVDKLFGRPVKTTRDDFVTLARLVADPVLLLVNSEQPYKTLKEFIDAAKKPDSAMVFSSGGLYGATHLPLAYLEKATGLLKLRHLPTNGGGPAITAILGNNAQVTTQSVSATLAHIKAGKLRPLASFGATRSKFVPDVPTLKELGYDVEYYLWVGIFAPKATPAPAVATLRAAIKQAAHGEAFMAVLANAGQELAYLDGPDFQKFWDIDGKRTDEAVISIASKGKNMILRADHVAGAFFVIFGTGIIALSGDLPTGQLSMPGSGFLPKIVATLTIIFGMVLILRARETAPFAELGWQDGKHAAMVTVITAAAIALYEHLGFFFTMLLMMFALLLVIERRNPLRAGIYCLAIVTFTYVSFVYGLKTPLPEFSF